MGVMKLRGREICSVVIYLLIFSVFTLIILMEYLTVLRVKIWNILQLEKLRKIGVFGKTSTDYMSMKV